MKFERINATIVSKEFIGKVEIVVSFPPDQNLFPRGLCLLDDTTEVEYVAVVRPAAMITSWRGNIVASGTKACEFAIGGESGKVVDVIPKAFVTPVDINQIVMDSGSHVQTHRMDLTSYHHPVPFPSVTRIEWQSKRVNKVGRVFDGTTIGVPLSAAPKNEFIVDDAADESIADWRVRIRATPVW